MSPSVKVSVIVPVYNPGSHIDDCISSVLNQSLPSDEYEVIFVDDGSTDGTGQRLAALAAEHSHVTAIRIENSGWPGRPRNVGIDAARGEFLYFMDNDDWISSEALERLYDRAVQNEADIVIGKMVGHGRYIPREIFRKNRDRATLDKDPLLSILTPHKLFRKQLLDKFRIRFPEGRRRLEDHVFVMKAFFCADTISVLSDYPCYHWVRREDDTNASRRTFDPRGYYDNVREVLDIVEEHTTPGPRRDALLRHWYRGKMLQRVGGRVLLSFPEGYRREILAEIRQLTQERFGPGVVAGLAAPLRVRSRALLAGRLDLLERLAELESGIRLQARLESVEWCDSGLMIQAAGSLTYADGGPVEFRREGERLFWRLPAPLDDEGGIQSDDLDVTADLARSRLGIILRRRADGTEYLLPVTAAPPDSPIEGAVTLRAASILDPHVAGAGVPLANGVWDFSARLVSCGWDVSSRLPAEVADGTWEELPPAMVGSPACAVTPYRTIHGNLSVRVATHPSTLLKGWRASAADTAIHVDSGLIRLAVPVPVLVIGHDGGLDVLLQLSAAHGSRRVTVPARLTQTDSGGRGASRLQASVPVAVDGPGGIGPGTWSLSTRLGPKPTALGLTLRLADGVATVLGDTAASAVQDAAIDPLATPGAPQPPNDTGGSTEVMRPRTARPRGPRTGVLGIVSWGLGWARRRRSL
jgi:glycosyltransferase involved in cell wall biosynthesis